MQAAYVANMEICFLEICSLFKNGTFGKSQSACIISVILKA